MRGDESPDVTRAEATTTIDDPRALFARSADFRGRATPAPPRGLLPVVAGALSVAAGLHVAGFADHAEGDAATRAFFVVTAVAQAAGAVLLLVLGTTRRLRWAVGLTNGAVAAVWAASRTVGLPFGVHAGLAERVGVLDGLSVAAEVVALVGLVALSGRGGPVARSGPRCALAWRAGSLGAVAVTASAAALLALALAPAAHLHDGSPSGAATVVTHVAGKEPVAGHGHQVTPLDPPAAAPVHGHATASGHPHAPGNAHEHAAGTHP